MKQKLLYLLSSWMIYCCAYATLPPAHSLQTRISNLQSAITQDKNQQNALQLQLNQTETTLGELAMQLQQTRQKIKQNKQALKNLDKKQTQENILLSSQTSNIAQQLRAIYKLGKPNYLQILLNQQDPVMLSRMLTYYTYINHERLQHINQLQQTLQQVADIKKTQETSLQQLLKFEQQQQKQQRNYSVMQHHRQQLLQAVNLEITNKNDQLSVLIANQTALERVVHHLRRNDFTLHSSHHNGKFPWPTAGKIAQPFGAAIEQSQLKSTGVLIKAMAGEPVHAIAGGKVVFAKWMSGYGLLLIIDHGNGLMSIYGRNNSLYKKRGDQVKPGELIATVGNSGGYQQSGLYFSLRQNGTPVDPAKWCG